MEKKEFRFVEISRQQYIYGFLLFAIFLFATKILKFVPYFRDLDDDASIILTMIKNVIVLCPLVYLFRDNIRSYLEDFRASGKKDNFKWYVKSVLILLGLTVVYAVLYVLALQLMPGTMEGIAGSKSANDQLLSTFFTHHPLLQLVQTVLIAPIIEELFFRHLLFNFLRQWNLYLAVVLTPLCFALPHVLTELMSGNMVLFLYSLMRVLLLSFSLTIIFALRKNVVFSVLLHFTNNTFMYLMNWLA